MSIAGLTGNGLLEKAKITKEQYQKSKELEDEIISDYEDVIIGDWENRVNYSIHEEPVIGTWIDGKPIYQKVFNNLNMTGVWEGQH